MEKTELKKGQWYTINNLGFENELKDIQMESWMGNQNTPIESKNGELWNQLRQGLEECLTIDKEFIKELSNDELEVIARDLQGGLIQIQTYEPFRRDLDLLCAISEEYVRRQQVKHHEEEERKKNLEISQVAVSEFMRHFWEETGVSIPNKYFQSFFKDK